MPTRNLILMIAGLALAFALSACGSPNPQPAALTPIPTLAPGPTLTLKPGIQGAPEGSTGAAGAAGADASALGAAVYLKNCTACHGTEGQGVDAPALRNNQFIQTGDQAAIFNTIANGRSGTAMPSWLPAH